MRHGRVVAAIAAIGAVALTVAGCTSTSSDDAKGTELVMAMVSPTAGQAYNFSPGYSDWDSLLVRPVYEFMITNRLDDNGQLTYGPGAATEWTFDDDFTTLTLKLREDATFTDGEPVNAEAVVANVQYWLDNEIGINWGRFAASAEATDEYTVVVTLSEAARPQGGPQVLFYLANSMLMSPAALKDPDELASNPVGSGPYVLDAAKTTAGVTYTYDRNPDFWNEAEYAYDSIVIKLYPDTVAAVNALKSGQVDFAPIDASTAADVTASGFETILTPGGVRGLMLGDKGGDINPAIADVRVRQAMNMAFDREAIAKNVEGGFADPTNQPWFPGFAQYQPDLEDLYPYDPEGAKKLLAEAGYPDGFDLVLPTYTDQPVLTKYDPIVKQSLEDIGIRVTYETTDWFTAVTEAKYAVTNNYIGTPLVQAYYLAHKGLFNPWDYEDPTMAEMLKTYNFGTAEERAEVAPEIGKYTTEQAWMLILATANALYAMDSDVKVITNLPLDASAPDFQYLKPVGD